MLVNLKKVDDIAKWKEDSKNVYIRRKSKFFPESKWANQHKFTDENSRVRAVEQFEHSIRSNSKLLNDLHELKDKTLGCWCHPLPCHGSILLKLLQENSTEMDDVQLDKDVKNALQKMNDVFENISQCHDVTSWCMLSDRCNLFL